MFVFFMSKNYFFVTRPATKNVVLLRMSILEVASIFVFVFVVVVAVVIVDVIAVNGSGAGLLLLPLLV